MSSLIGEILPAQFYFREIFLRAYLSFSVSTNMPPRTMPVITKNVLQPGPLFRIPLIPALSRTSQAQPRYPKAAFKRLDNETFRHFLLINKQKPGGAIASQITTHTMYSAPESICKVSISWAFGKGSHKKRHRCTNRNQQPTLPEFKSFFKLFNVHAQASSDIDSSALQYSSEYALQQEVSQREVCCAG